MSCTIALSFRQGSYLSLPGGHLTIPGKNLIGSDQAGAYVLSQDLWPRGRPYQQVVSSSHYITG